ncbi:hypothetical protein ACFVAQ_46015 [Streptomyces sp. NPDC057651]|uniref:hypothetical protein n=1 Tax=Streptomyces sp. NPDC057651 TaxID=3346194 RepID=UPI0036B588E9
MADTNPTGATDRATRRAEVRQLADAGESNREIARRLGIGKDTVRRDRAATEAPPAPDPAPAAPDPAPPAPTSGATRAPFLVRDLAPELIQDLNMLADPRTGQLPAPLARMLRAAADQARAAWRTARERQALAARPDADRSARA